MNTKIVPLGACIFIRENDREDGIEREREKERADVV